MKPGEASKEKRRKGRNIKSAYPRTSTENHYDAVDYLRAEAIARRHSATLNRVRDRVTSGNRLRVTFLVNDRAKWNASSLCEEMAARDWDVRICVSLSDAKGLDADGRRRDFGENLNFFEETGFHVSQLFDTQTDRLSPVEALDSDVTFLQQPWAMRDFPRRLCGRSLTAYMHYGFVIMANHGMHYNIAPFHAYLWRYFAQTNAHRDMHLQHDPSAFDRIRVTGYPKLDTYLPNLASSRNSGTGSALADLGEDHRPVIVALHHSLGKDNLRMATFRWSAERLLELAAKHQEMEWVYKPHPTLRHSVVRNKVMSAEQYQAYESSWEALPNATVYNSGNYFDLFKNSQALITDCGSFLAEYLPTGNPILWLDQEGSIGLNEVGESLSRGFYIASSWTEFSDLFDAVVVGRNDPLLDLRLQLVSDLFPDSHREETSARRVSEALANDIFG